MISDYYTIALIKMTTLDAGLNIMVAEMSIMGGWQPHAMERESISDCSSE